MSEVAESRPDLRVGSLERRSAQVSPLACRIFGAGRAHTDGHRLRRHDGSDTTTLAAGFTGRTCASSPWRDARSELADDLLNRTPDSRLRVAVTDQPATIGEGNFARSRRGAHRVSFERCEQVDCFAVAFSELVFGDAGRFDSFLEDEVAAGLVVGDEGVDPDQ